MRFSEGRCEVSIALRSGSTNEERNQCFGPAECPARDGLVRRKFALGGAAFPPSHSLLNPGGARLLNPKDTRPAARLAREDRMRSGDSACRQGLPHPKTPELTGCYGHCLAQCAMPGAASFPRRVSCVVQ